MILFGIFSGLNDLISCAILYCGIKQVNYCNVLMYMVFQLLNVVQLFATIGYYVQFNAFQSGSLVSSSSGTSQGFMIGFAVLLFAFYIVAVYVSFNAYKEFKALAQHAGMENAANPFSQMGDTVANTTGGSSGQRANYGTNQ